MPKLPHILLLLFLQLSAFAQQTPKIDPASPVLTTAREIARLPSLSPDLQPAVKLQATVTFVDSGGTVFLRDSTGATFLRGRQPPRYQPGQTLAITGVRFPGLYIGGIVPEKVDILATGPLPAPKSITLAELATGQSHYERVQIDGIGRSFEITGETTATLKLNVAGGILDVQFDQTPANGDAFIDAEIRVTGLAAGAINDHRQLVQPYLRAADGNAVSILKPAAEHPFSATDTTPLAALLDFTRNAAASHRVKISGTALGPVLNGSVFLRSGDRSIRIQTNQPIRLQPGDPVEALGFPEMGNFSAMLTDAVLKISPTEKSAIESVPLDPKNIANGSLDADLVTLDAIIGQRLESENTFTARAGNQSFRILSPNGRLPEFSPGTRARFTGIWLVTGAKQGGYRATPASHELWLRTPADAVLQSAPSWWNARKLAITLGIVAGAGLLILVWAAMLQRQVARQIKVIETKVQHEAMIEERQRIAREFHDTLEQELAGLSIRLDAAVPRVSDEKAKTLLGQLRHLLLRLQTETRDFVWDLRDESQPTAPLADSLKTLIDHLQTITPIPLELSTTENLPPIPALARHHLLRITREAVNNAIKYSSARIIRIDLQQRNEALHLTITDDGSGFENAAASGHFGLQGMKERVRKLGATLDLQSRPGHGTRVEVVLAIGGNA